MEIHYRYHFSTNYIFFFLVYEAIKDKYPLFYYHFISYLFGILFSTDWLFLRLSLLILIFHFHSNNESHPFVDFIIHIYFFVLHFFQQTLSQLIVDSSQQKQLDYSFKDLFIQMLEEKKYGFG
jgi:hypothetical protein